MRKNVFTGAMLGTTLALLSGTSLADDQFYSGVQINQLAVERDGISRSEVHGLTLRGGVALTELLSLEARIGKGFGSKTNNGIKAENDFYHSQLLRITLPTTTAFTPYALGGYGYIENRFNDQRVRDDGMATGFGTDYALDERISANLEYFRVVDNDKSKHFLINLGLTYYY